jgi:hypothetical protein
LLRAIDVANPGRELPETFREVDARMRSQLAELGITLPDVDNSGACYCGLCVMESITHVANSVARTITASICRLRTCHRGRTCFRSKRRRTDVDGQTGEVRRPVGAFRRRKAL